MTATAIRPRKRFNAATFAKVRDRHERGATEGERSAAGARMTALAESAGLTLAEAIAKTDPPKPATPVSIFEQLFNSPAFRAAHAERQARRAAVRETTLAALGSEEAVWAPHARETAVTAACQPLIIQKAIIGGTMDTLQGWDGGRYDGMPEAVKTAVSAAVPIANLREAWAEFEAWEQLYSVREAFFEHYEHPVAVRARISHLEHLLDTLPARSMNDLRTRLDWMTYLNTREWNRGNPEDGALLVQLRDDIERMGARLKDAEARATGRAAT